MILAVDPGDSTGWATFEDDGVLMDHGIDTFDTFIELLHYLQRNGFEVRAIVYERYRLDHRARKQQGSSVVAAQVIGALKVFALLWGCAAVPQELGARDMGYVHGRRYGLHRAADHHQSHDRDAIAHGVTWLLSNKIEPNLSDL